MGQPYKKSTGKSLKPISEDAFDYAYEEQDYLYSIYKTVQPLSRELNKVYDEVADVRADVAALEHHISEQIEKKLEDIMMFLTAHLVIKPQNIAAEEEPINEDPHQQSLMSHEPVDEFMSNSPRSLMNKDKESYHQTSDKSLSATEISSQKNAQNHPSPERLPNGDFDLDAPFRIPTVLTEQEEKILNFWPQVLLPSQVHRYGETFPGNKVTFPVETKLSSINDEVIGVLNDVQKILINTRTPYELWPIWLASIMDGDFRQIACWAEATNITWLDIVEAILQVLQKYQKFSNPRNPFDNLSSDKENTQQTDLELLREAFYQLPEHKRMSSAIKQKFISKIQQDFPRVFLSMQDKKDKLSTAYTIEEAINIDRLLTRSDRLAGKTASRGIYSEEAYY